MKLLFVVNDLDYFYSHRLGLAKAALEEGFEIHVASPQGSFSRNQIEPKFFFHQIPMTRRGVFHLREWKTFRALKALFLEVNPDIVHNVTIKPIIFGSLASQAANVPGVVNTVSGLGFVFADTSLRTRVLRVLALIGYRLSFRHHNSIAIFQNIDDRVRLVKSVGGGLSEKSVVIRGSGVDTNLWRPVLRPTGPPTVVLASRMLHHKGITDFVQAARIVRERRPETRWVLAGVPDTGNPASHTERELREWGEEGVVEWMGWVGDVPALFATSRVVVLPSYYGEGVPKVLIEAAACGRAIVTTDTPGCRDIVENNVNGLLVPTRSPQDLAQVIEYLLDNPTKCDKMGQAGRKRVEDHFSMKSVNEATVNVYKRVIQGIPD